VISLQRLLFVSILISNVSFAALFQPPEPDEVTEVSPAPRNFLQGVSEDDVDLNVFPEVIDLFLRNGKIIRGIDPKVFSRDRLTLRSGKLKETPPSLKKLIDENPAGYDLRNLLPLINTWGVIVIKTKQIIFFELLNDKALRLYNPSVKNFEKFEKDGFLTLVL